uniref:Uncharacterized protein n=1 Tax=Anguilla anguilla TaxID=7936 RepID=A0A0E9TSP3_ANGAN
MRKEDYLEILKQHLKTSARSTGSSSSTVTLSIPPKVVKKWLKDNYISIGVVITKPCPD